MIAVEFVEWRCCEEWLAVVLKSLHSRGPHTCCGSAAGASHLHALGLTAGAVCGLDLEQLLTQTLRTAAAWELALRQLVRKLRATSR